MVVSNQGSIVLFTAETKEETAWLDENVQSEPWQWLGKSLAVDHHLARALFQGVLAAGFEVQS